MLSTVYQSPLSVGRAMPGWWSIHAPIFGSVSESEGREAAGLVNESISGRGQSGSVPVFHVDPHPERRTPVAVAVVNPGGIAVKLQGKTSVFNPSGKGDRGVVTGRSRRSRRRLMDRLSRVDMKPYAAQRKKSARARGVFLTLTYPADFPSWQVAKDDLATFRKRLQRSEFRCEWAVWVEEFQQRGAVHFHLVVVWPGIVKMAEFRHWVSRSWYEVVGSGDLKHLHAGTQAVAVHLQDGVGSLMSYLAGELGKVRQTRPVDPDTGEFIETGRTWGFWNKGAVPCVTIAVVALWTADVWKEFKCKVGDVFGKSPYFRHVPEYSEWRGALLYGDGLELLGRLCEGLDVDFRSLRPLGG